MLNSNEVQLKLKSLLLEESTNYVIQLYGRWGVGKTHLWNKVIESMGDKKKIVKVSLFDKNSIDELKEDIVLQTYSLNKHIKQYGSAIDVAQKAISKILGGSVGVVPNVSSLLSFLKQSDFDNIIISFDDIERRNEKFNFDTFLGYVSLLKEDKKCNVVLILNYDKLNEKDKEVFDKYKEKIIDYNLILQKDSEEAISNSLNESLLRFDEELKYIVSTVSTDNIRIIKHMIKMLKELEQINFDDYSKYILSSFIQAYVYYSYIYYSYGIDSLNKLFEYKQKNLEKIFEEDENKKIESNKDYDEVLQYEDLIKTFFDLDNEVYIIFDEIMKSHFLSNKNKTKLEKKLTQLSNEETLIIATQKINDSILNYRLDLFNSIDYYYDDIISEIRKHKENIVRKMSVRDFFFNIDFLIKKDSAEIKEIEKECIEFYLKWIVDYEQDDNELDRDFDRKTPIDYLEERDSNTGTNYIDRLNELRSTALPMISSLLIIETLQKFNDNRYYDIDERIINTIEEKNILNCMKEDINYAKTIFFFIRDNENKEEVSSFWEKGVNVVKEIYNENNLEINEKIKKIFHEKDYKNIIDVINPPPTQGNTVPI